MESFGSGEIQVAADREDFHHHADALHAEKRSSRGNSQITTASKPLMRE
jgi:hypothetical protein